MRVVQIDQFCQESEEVGWLIDGLLADTGWTLFYSPPGTGKSTFALQLCEALNSGTPFLGRSVQKTPFVYIQADGSGGEWREMCKRIAPKCTGKSIIDVPTGAMDNMAYVEYIDRAIKALKPGFVVFDSLYNLTSADINTPKILLVINQMKQLARGNSIPWMLIHHPTKSDSTSPAGSGSLQANCSNDWNLTKTKLNIIKGRLVKEKEIPLMQDDQFLWHPYVRKATANTITFRRD